MPEDLDDANQVGLLDPPTTDEDGLDSQDTSKDDAPLPPCPVVPRDAKGRVLPGQSLNPHGSRRVTRVVKLARTYTRRAVQELALIAFDKDNQAKTRVTALTALLDRGWGKPDKALIVTGASGGAIEHVHAHAHVFGPGDLASLTDDELAAYQALHAKLSGGPGRPERRQVTSSPPQDAPDSE